ncbi:hypothetical protein EVAR_65042_1 [Eumeta japonica]|uniref:Uncharacterized protein n=1 Tax=Eumeta variegata TaxID=151549 RepID=A0A4C1YUV3_EUMVA|nr:hypothetical protein EVAR_65042_1 [Eumeta japonica]
MWALTKPRVLSAPAHRCRGVDGSLSYERTVGSLYVRELGIIYRLSRLKDLRFEPSVLARGGSAAADGRRRRCVVSVQNWQLNALSGKDGDLPRASTILETVGRSAQERIHGPYFRCAGVENPVPGFLSPAATTSHDSTSLVIVSTKGGSEKLF